LNIANRVSIFVFRINIFWHFSNPLIEFVFSEKNGKKAFANFADSIVPTCEHRLLRRYCATYIGPLKFAIATGIHCERKVYMHFNIWKFNEYLKIDLFLRIFKISKKLKFIFVKLIIFNNVIVKITNCVILQKMIANGKATIP
jgi:hypothetical protein